MMFWLCIARIHFNLWRMARLQRRADALFGAGRYAEAGIIAARLRVLDLETDLLFQRIEQRAEGRLA